MPSGSLELRLKPVYPIAVASELTGVSPVMIREYEKAEMLKPHRVKGKRRFSDFDVANINLLHYYLSRQRMTLNGLKVLLRHTPCHEIKNCRAERCPAFGRIKNECWEVASNNDECDPRMCPACPLYIVRTAKHSVDAPPETPTSYKN